MTEIEQINESREQTAEQNQQAQIQQFKINGDEFFSNYHKRGHWDEWDQHIIRYGMDKYYHDKQNLIRLYSLAGKRLQRLESYQSIRQFVNNHNDVQLQASMKEKLKKDKEEQIDKNVYLDFAKCIHESNKSQKGLVKDAQSCFNRKLGGNIGNDTASCSLMLDDNFCICFDNIVLPAIDAFYQNIVDTQYSSIQ